MSATRMPRSARGLDLYETPEWVTRAIVHELPPACTPALDPCAGRGAILRVLRNEGYHVHGIELDPGCAREVHGLKIGCAVGDALVNDWVSPPLVVMNPPFNRAAEFVHRALMQRAHGGSVFALLRLGFLESKARREFHEAHPSDVFVLAKRPSFVNGRTDASAYAWFAWGPGRGGRWSILPSEGDPF